MFNIYGDEIVFQGWPVAQIDRRAGPTLRAEFINAMEAVTTEVETLERERQAENDGYARGCEDGLAEGEKLAKADFEEKKDEIYNEGVAEGRADALADCERAADASRVHDLLLAVAEAQNMAYATANNRKDTLRSCRSALLQISAVLANAQRAYDKPNGAD